MTSTFLLPLSIWGSVKALGGNLMTDAFGVVALVALTPIDRNTADGTRNTN